MATPLLGPLALTDLPMPCTLGREADVVAYELAARLLTPSDAPREWNDPTPIACLDLRAYVGSRLAGAALADLERRCAESLAQSARVRTVAVSLSLAEKALRCAVSGTYSNGVPFAFTIEADQVTAQILRGS